MTPEIEALKQEIADHMVEWSAVFIQNRIDFLRKRKIEASGDLLRSFEAEINRQARREAVELLLAFEEHGRYIDMKRLSTPKGGGDYIAAIEAWIREKGFADKFTQKFLQKYRLTKVPANVLNKIAWGIAVSRSKGKFRRRQWYNKPKTAAITELFTQVAAMIPDKVAEQLKKQLSQPIQ